MKRHRPLRTPPSQTTKPPKPTTSISSFYPSKKPKPISSNLKTPVQTPLKWTPLNLPKSELYLPLTFPTGQTFRWKQTSPYQYTGVIGSHLISLNQNKLKDTSFCIHNLNGTSTNTNQESVKLALLDFLNMGISLNDLWTEFSACDKRFAELAVHLSGARVLRQDPLECLVQFICSSNNNISRITKMVDYVSCLGEFVGVVEGVEFYKFPSLERLAELSEDELRKAGFGYRAKYITGTVKKLQSKPGGGVEWLLSLRKLDLESAIKALTTLPGVGPKVAACIALFSLDQHHAIPVDTHVWKIATRDLLPELAGTRLTLKVSSRVSDAFVKKFGKYAGWAQTLLFIAELPSQKALLQSLTDETKDAVKDEIDELQQSVVLPSQKALLQALTNETKYAVKDEIDELQQSVVKEEEET